jgi:hypothetical protein
LFRSVADGRLRYQRLWIAGGWGFVALVIYLSLTPDPLRVNPEDLDVKLDHMLAYAWMMFWFAQIVKRPRSRVGVGLALIAMGIALEYVQRWTGYRHFAYSDMRDDALGVTLGFLIGSTPLDRMLSVVESKIFKQ